MIEEHVEPTAEVHAHLSNLLRTLVTAAAGMADKRAQRRQAQAQEAARAAETERRAFEERMHAQRQAAFLVYRGVHQDRWWERATPEAIAGAVEAAGAWIDLDPRAHDAWAAISDRLGDRYGIDLDDLARQARAGAAPSGQVASTIRDQVNQAEQAASEARAARQAASGVAPQDRWKAEVLDVAGAGLGVQIIRAEGWPRLQARLDKLQDTGKNPARELRGAISQRELDTAMDKAITLVWRMKDAPGRTAISATGPSRPPRREAAPPGKHTPEGPAERLARKKRAEQNRLAGPEAGRDG